MIDLYTWPTPNGYKVPIALEEMDLQYRVIRVDITKGEQLAPDFLKISPNNRIPAIVDHEAQGGPLSLFESGAILFYLAQKTGQFMGKTPGEQATVMQWLMWQMGGVGPMMGQAFHFHHFALEKVPYAMERYLKETQRLLNVLNQQLAQKDFVAGFYSIADMALYPWIKRMEKLGLEVTHYPHIATWCERMEARPAVQRALSCM
ncbi:MAG: glutathione binding-like protein [Holosporales bacterium]